jgi:hypothetical protein
VLAPKGREFFSIRQRIPQNPDLSQQNPDLSQQNPDLSQQNPDLSQQNPDEKPCNYMILNIKKRSQTY